MFRRQAKSYRTLFLLFMRAAFLLWHLMRNFCQQKEECGSCYGAEDLSVSHPLRSCLSSLPHKTLSHKTLCALSAFWMSHHFFLGHGALSHGLPEPGTRGKDVKECCSSKA